MTFGPALQRLLRRGGLPLGAALTALALGGCAVPSGGGVAYKCGGGAGFSASYGFGSATVRFSGERKELTLQRVASAAGDKYSDGRTTLWVKGREAYVERSGQPAYFGCTAQ